MLRLLKVIEPFDPASRSRSIPKTEWPLPKVKRRLASISFIVPHMRLTTGGIYSIVQYASNLPEHITVNMLVLKVISEDCFDLPTRHIELIAEDVIPDADAIVLHADSPHGAAVDSLSRKKGKKILYLQGFNAPGNPVVQGNLLRDWGVLASSRWLEHGARKLGRECAYVPYGIDRELFYPWAPTNVREENTIAMMTHVADWKGTRDGLEALRAVHKEDGSIKIKLFGTMTDEVRGSGVLDFADFFDRPGRKEVGDILRCSSVFVCPSWEEGFGMPGLEALACGTALVTTDTKGGRDYAVNGKTAVVTPPRQPSILARSILNVLSDPRLRRSIVRAGLETAKSYPDWRLSTRLFQDAIEGLVS